MWLSENLDITIMKRMSMNPYIPKYEYMNHGCQSTQCGVCDTMMMTALYKRNYDVFEDAQSTYNHIQQIAYYIWLNNFTLKDASVPSAFDNWLQAEKLYYRKQADLFMTVPFFERDDGNEGDEGDSDGSI